MEKIHKSFYRLVVLATLIVMAGCAQVGDTIKVGGDKLGGFVASFEDQRAVSILGDKLDIVNLSDAEQKMVESYVQSKLDIKNTTSMYKTFALTAGGILKVQVHTGEFLHKQNRKNGVSCRSLKLTLAWSQDKLTETGIVCLDKTADNPVWKRQAN